MSRAEGGSSFGPAASGWFVEIDHPSGHVHTPAVLTGSTAPQRNPVANGLPTIQVPVAQNDKWSHESFEDAPMRVWKDGERQPIGRLETVEQTEAATVLRGRGGLDLKRRFQAEVKQEPTADFVEGAIDDTTPYTPHVDRPVTTRENGIRLHSATRDGDFESRLSLDATDPVTVEDGAVKLTQTAYPQDAYLDGARQGGDATDPRTARSDDAYNAGIAAILNDEGETLRFQFTPEHDIPAKHVGIKARDETPDNSLVRVSWNGQELTRVGNPKGLGWHDLAQRFTALSSSGLRAGETYGLTFEVLEGYSSYYLDVVALYDQRETLTAWPNPSASENGGGVLAGPQLYPHTHNVFFDAAVPPRAVVGATLSASGREGSSGPGLARLGFSNDQRETYYFKNDVGTYDADFDEPGPAVTPIVTLAREGDDPSRQEIPTKGFECQWLTSYRLDADLEDIPLVVNQSFDGALVDVLSSVADDANAVFEFRREGDVESVEWTRLGQRVVERTPAIADYSTTKDTSERVAKAVVYGGSREITNEYHYLDDREPIGLKHGRLRQGTVTAVGSVSGVEFRPGRDYTVDHDAGVIDPAAGGRLDPGDGIDVSYSYQTYGEYAAPGIDSPRETVVDATGLTSDFAAQQTATAIVEELSEPLHRGTVTVAGDEAGFSVVAAIAAADLPGTVASGVSGGLQVKEVEHEPGEARIRFGSRRTLETTVSDIESNIAAVSREL